MEAKIHNINSNNISSQNNGLKEDSADESFESLESIERQIRDLEFQL